MWGYVKSLVYGQRPQNEADLPEKITTAFAQITRKCCAPRGATCPRGMNYVASAVAVMLSVDVLGHESGVPPTRVRTINFLFVFVTSQTDHPVVSRVPFYGIQRRAVR
jgi:hypothetical protein